MPRGDANREISILQMADNATAEKSAAAKYGHASARHVTKVSCCQALSDLSSAFREAKPVSASRAQKPRVTSIDEFQACARPSFASGTNGSNPAPSSGESRANLKTTS